MSALQPARPEPSGPEHEGHEVPPTPSARKAARRRTAVAWPAPAPQAVPPGARRTAPVIVPDPAPEPAPAPPVAGPFPRFVPPRAAAPSPPSPPVPPAFAHRFQAPAPAPTPPAAPVSLAGADLPAALAPTPAGPAVPELPDEPLAEQLARPAASPRPRTATPPAAPKPPAAPAQRIASGSGTSSAPPGFSGQRLVIAESAELLALDPSLDEDAQAGPAASALAASAPVASRLSAVPALPELTPEEAASLAGPLTITLPGAAPPGETPIKEVGGSCIAGLIASAVPRRSDRARFGRDRAATARIAFALIAISVLVVVAGPVLANLLRPLPVIGPAVEGLESLALYPRAYGVLWLTATLGIVSIAGVVFAQMEKSAERQDMRRDPSRRLNIALTSVLALAMGAGAMSVLHSHGWAAAASATTFFAALCLVVPLARMPGARAMSPQPERAWGLLFLAAIPAVIIAPSVPTIMIAVLAFTHVRTHWSGVAENADEHADGPIDRTNRRAALIITIAVLLAGSVGLHTMGQSPDELRALQTQERTNFPGAEQGPEIGSQTP